MEDKKLVLISRDDKDILHVYAGTKDELINELHEDLFDAFVELDDTALINRYLKSWNIKQSDINYIMKVQMDQDGSFWEEDRYYNIIDPIIRKFSRSVVNSYRGVEFFDDIKYSILPIE